MPISRVTTDKVRVGIVGLGFGQSVGLPAFALDPRCEVVALCASTVERAQQVATEQHIGKAYGNWRELAADPEIDAVAIATIPSLQAEIALAMLGAEKAVFCEKPLATSFSDAKQLAECAERSALPNMVDFEFGELSTWRHAKALLEVGKLGTLRHACVTWNVETYANKMKLASWKSSAEAGGGCLNLFVSHVFYYLEWLLGTISELSCKLSRAPGDNRSADTLAVLCLEFERGFTASLSVSNHAYLGGGHRLEIYGDEGSLLLDNPTKDYASGFSLFYGDRSIGRLERIGDVERAQAHAQEFQDGRIAPVACLTQRFIDWIITGKPSIPTFRDALRVQALIEAAQLSDRSGCWVSVKS